jgi:hypothetical protein
MQPMSSFINRRIYFFIFFILPVAFNPGCGDSNDSEDGVVNAVVIRSDGNNYPEFWSELNVNWSTYGSVEISVDDVRLDYPDITYDQIASLNPDVLIIDDARNPLENEVLTYNEVNNIYQYTRQGHGLIITGGTFRPDNHTKLIALTGFSANIQGQVYYSTALLDSMSILGADHPLFDKLSIYDTGSDSFYSGSDWDLDGRKGYPGDWIMELKNSNADILAFIWNRRNDQPFETSVISCLDEPSYKVIFAGHSPVNENSTNDDFQFYYNAIIYCSGK